MWYYVVKIVISALLITVISEVAKRNTLFGAILASVPLVSVIAIIWLYHDTGDTVRISALVTSIFWLVIPSLALFISLSSLLRQGVAFYLSIIISIAITALCYWLMLQALKVFGVSL